jgi:hypothetical protein
MVTLVRRWAVSWGMPPMRWRVMAFWRRVWGWFGEMDSAFWKRRKAARRAGDFRWEGGWSLWGGRGVPRGGFRGMACWRFSENGMEVLFLTVAW